MFRIFLVEDNKCYKIIGERARQTVTSKSTYSSSMLGLESAVFSHFSLR